MNSISGDVQTPVVLPVQHVGGRGPTGGPIAPAAGWARALPGFLLLVAAVLWFYRDTALAMVSIWSRSETFAHAFTVPPIVAWLVWRRRHDLAAVTPQPSAFALPALCAAVSLWLLGELTEANSVAQLAFTATLVLAVPALLGLQVTRVLLFPLGFLFFAVPFGEFLMPQLMTWTADFTVAALRLSGIPVYREGLQFVIPSGNWSVVEACSGIRYLIASVMVGVLFAHLNYQSARRRWAFIGVALVVPLVANWVRAYLIVLLGHLSGNRLAVGFDHLIYGWAFFALVITVMFMIGIRWSEPPAESVEAAQVPPAPHRHASFWTLTAAAVLVVAPHVALARLDRTIKAGIPRLAPAAAWAPGWQVDDVPLADWKPAFEGSAAESRLAYERAGRHVGLYIGYYRAQNYQKKLVSSENTLVTLHDKAWSQTASATREVDTTEQRVRVRSARLRASSHPGQPAGTGLVAWQVYWVDGHWTANDAEAKLWGALQRLLGRGDDGAVAVVFTYEDEARGADLLLESFLRENLHSLNAQLILARDGG